uniref:AlNc14C212G8929 protein n=1 Tax=Albugo laibachii Nc14 TaxID=890382 RepID=F0WRC4_9STRA|nr:AlNc14C212G8929 [Albugo laibachii Nc14]|eukprot:CCA23887.1 AlNc14C212G8929 [Albugo laibachii Nc14]
MGCNQSTAREPETAEITVPSVEENVVDAGTKTTAHVEDPLESTDRVDPLEQNSVTGTEDIVTQTEEKQIVSVGEQEEPRNETEEMRDEDQEVEVPSSGQPEQEEMKPYRVSGHTVTPKDVVFYVIETPEGTINRRYNDFKTLYGSLKTASALPSLPSSYLSLPFASRVQHAKMIKTREERFEAILNAIAKDSTIFDSDGFQKFISDQVATPEDEDSNEASEVKEGQDTNEIEGTNEVTEVQVVVEKEVKEHFEDEIASQEDAAAIPEATQSGKEQVEEEVTEAKDADSQIQTAALREGIEEESTDLIVNQKEEESKQQGATIA